MKLLYYPRIGITCVFILLNTLLIGCLLYPLSLVKWLCPAKSVQRALSPVFARLAEIWNFNNSIFIRSVCGTRLEITGDLKLDRNDWYYVTSNHQSWADILILQIVFNRRIPLLKFFLKKELMKIPLLGIAWWALDFPFMQRSSKSEIKKNPALKGKDMETTRLACEKFMEMPTSIMNFFEGTRFTPEKHRKQQSPYRHLLKPKAGGTAFALAAMQGKLTTLLDVTLIYPDNAPTNLLAFLGGRTQHVKVIVTRREIPAWASQGDYQNDREFRLRFHKWMGTIWAEKDALIDTNR